MEVEIDYTKNAYENANIYYERSKKLLKKIDGAKVAISNLSKSIAATEHSTEEKQKKTFLLHNEWYEKFHWFNTSDGLLAIGGRDAHQNELVNSKHFSDNDLFFHANIFGASVFILKDGLNAPKKSREETAAFSACYSSAWKDGLGSVDVYAMHRDQVSKSTGKGSLGTGSFLLKGDREWFRNVPLTLLMHVDGNALKTDPLVKIATGNAIKIKYVVIRQGRDKKSDAAKKIASMLNYPDIDYIMRQLPAGEFKVSEFSV